MLLYNDKKTMVNMLLLPLMFAAISIVLVHFSETEYYEYHFAMLSFVVLVAAIALLGNFVAMSAWLLKAGGARFSKKRYWRLMICLNIISAPAMWEGINHTGIANICSNCFYSEVEMFSPAE